MAWRLNPFTGKLQELVTSGGGSFAETDDLNSVTTRGATTTILRLVD